PAVIRQAAQVARWADPLELFRNAGVDESASRIVKQVREVVIRPRWIVIENVVDAERDCRLIEQISPRRPAINQALFWLGVGLYLIRRLHIEEPCLPDPMLIDPVRAK